MLGVEGEAEVCLLSREAKDVEVVIDGDKRTVDVAVVLGDTVTTIDQVVCHDVDEVDMLPDLGRLLGGEGDHVLFKTRGGDRHDPVTDSPSDGEEEEREVLDVSGLSSVGDLAVVSAVTAGILPVDVDTIVAHGLEHVGDTLSESLT